MCFVSCSRDAGTLYTVMCYVSCSRDAGTLYTVMCHVHVMQVHSTLWCVMFHVHVMQVHSTLWCVMFEFCLLKCRVSYLLVILTFVLFRNCCHDDDCQFCTSALSRLSYAICSSCTLCCMCSWQINDDDDVIFFTVRVTRCLMFSSLQMFHSFSVTTYTVASIVQTVGCVALIFEQLTCSARPRRPTSDDGAEESTEQSNWQNWHDNDWVEVPHWRQGCQCQCAFQITWHVHDAISTEWWLVKMVLEREET